VVSQGRLLRVKKNAMPCPPSQSKTPRLERDGRGFEAGKTITLSEKFIGVI